MAGAYRVGRDGPDGNAGVSDDYLTLIERSNGAALTTGPHCRVADDT
jgi:hypothetical protein